MVYKTGYIGRCEEHQKRLWRSRKDARAVAREHHGDRKSVYRCDIHQGCFHVGSLWDEVKHGDLSRDDMADGCGTWRA